MKKMIKDYEEHGFTVASKKRGMIVFETNPKDEKKNNKRKDDHPIYLDDEYKDMGSRITIKSKCLRDNEYLLDDGKCPKCGRKFRIAEYKPHIPYKHEIDYLISKR